MTWSDDLRRIERRGPTAPADTKRLVRALLRAYKELRGWELDANIGLDISAGEGAAKKKAEAYVQELWNESAG